jgi:hypothetical protein
MPHKPNNKATNKGNQTMLRFRSFRAASAVALAGAIGLVAVSFAGPATASGSRIKCTQLTGFVGPSPPDPFSLSGCSGNTGGGSAQFANIFSSPLTIPWLNGKTTTVMWTSSTTETDPTETMTCPAGQIEEEFKGTVTADSTGSAPVGGVAKGEVCVTKILPSTFSNEAGSAFKFK